MADQSLYRKARHATAFQEWTETLPREEGAETPLKSVQGTPMVVCKRAKELLAGKGFSIK